MAIFHGAAVADASGNPQERLVAWSDGYFNMPGADKVDVVIAVLLYFSVQGRGSWICVYVGEQEKHFVFLLESLSCFCPLLLRPRKTPATCTFQPFCAPHPRPLPLLTCPPRLRAPYQERIVTSSRGCCSGRHAPKRARLESSGSFLSRTRETTDEVVYHFPAAAIIPHTGG